MPDSESPYVEHANALVAFAQDLVADARVMVVGPATSSVADQLLELDARLVHVYDPVLDFGDLAAMPERRGVKLLPLPRAEFEVREGAYDVAIIDRFGSLLDPAATLARVRRAVGVDGVVIVDAANMAAEDVADPVRAFDYYDLFDMVALQFEHVRMVAVLPLVGMTFAELGGDADVDSVSVDTSLAGDRTEPSRFVVVASQRAVDIEPYAIVEIPGDSRIARPPPESLSRAQIAQATLRADLSQAQLDRERDRIRALEARLAERDAEVKRLQSGVLELEPRVADDHQLEALEVELESERSLRRELERQLERSRPKATSATTERVQLLERELATTIEQHDLWKGRADEAERAVAQLDARCRALETDLGESADALAASMSRVSELEASLATLEREVGVALGPAEDELHKLETQLRERAHYVRELEREIERRGALVRDLMIHLAMHEDASGHAAAGAPPPDASPASNDAQIEVLRRKLDELAMENARYAADLQASKWQLAIVERKLAEAGTSAPPDEVVALQQERDALRQALAQEHQARLEAERDA